MHKRKQIPARRDKSIILAARGADGILIKGVKLCSCNLNFDLSFAKLQAIVEERQLINKSVETKLPVKSGAITKLHYFGCARAYIGIYTALYTIIQSPGKTRNRVNGTMADDGVSLSSGERAGRSVG